MVVVLYKRAFQLRHSNTNELYNKTGFVGQCRTRNTRRTAYTRRTSTRRTNSTPRRQRNGRSGGGGSAWGGGGSGQGGSTSGGGRGSEERGGEEKYFLPYSERYHIITQMILKFCMIFPPPGLLIFVSTFGIDLGVLLIFQQILMNILKELRPTPTPSPSLQKQKKKSLPLIGALDYCYRYRPLADRGTFEEQLDHTERELIEYFPSDLSQQYLKFESTTRYMTIGFWAATLGFAGLCHRIGFLSRVLGDRTWKMFTFKVAALVLPYMAMDSIMPAAEAQEMDLLWKGMGDSYKRYKYSGDILQLNKDINLTGEGLGTLPSSPPSERSD